MKIAPPVAFAVGVFCPNGIVVGNEKLCDPGISFPFNLSSVAMMWLLDAVVKSALYSTK
ncbi:hypothetical protein PBN151_1758 [Paenibacillus sp. NAIST15-1]|nr:hypothetical protein PBN151_1758 [Paenibacillus sp. NAIST15-1]